MSQENVEVVRRVYKALSARDLAVLFSLTSQEVEAVPLLTGLEGRVFRGHEGLALYVETMFETWDTVTWEPIQFREAESGRLVCRVRMHGVGRDGIEVDQLLGAVFTLRDGLVVRAEAYPREEEALEAVGLTE